MAWIDIAKGIGILLMIFGHCDYIGTAQRWVYSFHMPLFFVLSGVLYSYKEEHKLTVRDMLIRKAKGLLIPYFLLSLAYVIYMLFFKLLNGYFSWEDIKLTVIRTLILVGEGNFWFIPSLFLATILFHVLRNAKIRVFISVIALFLVVCFFPNGNSQYSLITLFLKSVIGMFFIHIGTTLAMPLKKIEEKENKFLFLLLIVMIGVNMLSYYWNGNTAVDLNTIRVNNAFLYVVATISGVCACIIASIILKKSRLLEYFGRNSIWFLALNNLVLFTGTIGNVLLRFFPTMNYQFVFLFWLCVIIYEVVAFELIQKVWKVIKKGSKN